MREIFILIPSMQPTGPIKGAIALANALVAERKVTLVTLKPGPGAEAFLDPRVRQLSLAEYGTLPRKARAYRQILREAGGRAKVASISSCFTPDMTNVLCRDVAVTCASVRGNLSLAYRMDYGLPGVPLAAAHLTALRGVDHVVAMTSAMARQISRYTGRSPAVIGNFLDEPPLDQYRAARNRGGPLRFVFLGRLTKGKRPGLLIDALADLRAAGVDVRADIVGDGPLRQSLVEQIQARGLNDVVTMHGHIPTPYSILAAADALVLPSLGEGLPRAGMEALYLGVACVLRDTDGNAELVKSGVNGVLFKRDSDLSTALLEAADCARKTSPGMSLLPDNCRQQSGARSFLNLVEMH